MYTAPTFSIVIPVYNVSVVIEDTLNSVYNQTFTDFEIIAVNDGSTDDTLQILKKQTDQRLIIIDKANGGVSSARNRGIRAANGKYIAFIDADDIWSPSHLANALLAFKSMPSVVWYSCKSIISTNMQFPKTYTKPKFIPVNYFTHGCVYVNSSTTIIKGDIAKIYNELFPENMNNAEDWVAWVKIASKYPTIVISDNINAICRLRLDSATRRLDYTISHQYLSFIDQILPLYNSSNHPFHNFLKYRSLERWLISISKHNTNQLIEILTKHKLLLGKIESTIIKLYLQTNAFITKLICKVLSIIDNRRTKIKIKEINDFFEHN